MWVAVKGERDYQAGDLRVFWMCLLTSSRRRRRQIKFREVPFKKAMVILVKLMIERGPRVAELKTTWWMGSSSSPTFMLRTCLMPAMEPVLTFEEGEFGIECLIPVISELGAFYSASELEDPLLLGATFMGS